MAKMFNYYANDVDHTWYDSSNIKYSECIDKENSLKTLKVVFNNGSQYEYRGVDVNDYLMFREDMSQGKALGKYIKSKGYEYSKLDNIDVSALDDELLFRSRGGYYVKYNSNELMVLDSKDAVVYTKEGEFTYESTVEPLVGTMEAIGHHVKVEKLEKE